MQAVEGLIHSNGMKFQQDHQVSDLVNSKFILPFCQKCNPLNKKPIQQWFRHYFDNITILETFDNIKKYITHIILVIVYSTIELSCIE